MKKTTATAATGVLDYWVMFEGWMFRFVRKTRIWFMCWRWELWRASFKFWSTKIALLPVGENVPLRGGEG